MKKDLQRRWDVHSPFCPDMCIISASIEDIMTCWDWLDKNQIEQMKKGEEYHFGGDWKIICIKERN